MSRLLVDTHLLLWLAEDSVEMPEEAARQLKDESHEIFFSVASIWEVAIKYSLGRKDFAADSKVLRTGLLGIGFREVPIAAAHVVAVSRLPHHHGDPFDRLLVVQAELEGLILLTADKVLTRYGPHVQRCR